MLIKNNEITITRGEAFSFVSRLINKDGSPYIVAKGLNNPYWLISVSASQFYQVNGYLMEVWSSAQERTDDIPQEEIFQPYPKRFEITQAIDVTTVGDVFISWEDWALPTGYDGSNLNYADVAVFKHYNNETDEWEYRYYDKKIGHTGEAVGSWREYANIVAFQFTTDMTSRWSEQNYFYSLTLASGTTTAKELYQRCLDNGLRPATSDDVIAMYNDLYSIDPKLVEDIDPNSPLASVIEDIIILPPTKLSVVSNMRGVKNYE